MSKIYNWTHNSLYFGQDHQFSSAQKCLTTSLCIATAMNQSYAYPEEGFLTSDTQKEKLNPKTIRQKLIRSGEIFKQPSFDELLTDSEQITFSFEDRNKSTLPSVRTRAGAVAGTTGTRVVPATALVPVPEKARRVLRKKIGDYINCGEKIGLDDGTPIVLGASGKIIKITEKQITLQKTQTVLYYSQANVHVERDAWVERGDPILTLTHQTLITGDIIQGIPRIEQLFEAPHSPLLATISGGESNNLHESLHTQVREIFRENWLKAPLPAAVRHSLQQLQQILVESIQKVYLSQGVLIADKHIEIVVRQMTSKAELIDGGSTGLFMEELLPVQQIENANLTTPGKKAKYVPAVIGLTRSALEADSFISAASFQETTRVLSRDALIGVSDFLRGLKEKVVIGDLISAGTGLDLYFAYTLLSNPRDPNRIDSLLKIDHLESM